MEDLEKEFDELATMVVGGYNLLAQVFGELPLPIVIQRAEGVFDLGEAVKALERVRLVLLPALPLDNLTRLAIGNAILDWTTAVEIGQRCVEYGITRTRLDAMSLALRHLAAGVDILEEEGPQ